MLEAYFSKMHQFSATIIVEISYMEMVSRFAYLLSANKFANKSIEWQVMKSQKNLSPFHYFVIIFSFYSKFRDIFVSHDESVWESITRLVFY